MRPGTVTLPEERIDLREIQRGRLNYGNNDWGTEIIKKEKPPVEQPVSDPNRNCHLNDLIFLQAKAVSGSADKSLNSIICQAHPEIE